MVTDPTGGTTIDRRALVRRHTVEVTGVEAASPLSVGNGEFCCTVDFTGLQTFPALYPVAARDSGEPGTLLGTQSQWGWHSMPGGEGFDLTDTRRLYQTPRGPVPYVDMTGNLSGTTESPGSRAESWLRCNPHRLDLGRIGLVLAPTESGRGPTPPALTEISQVRQRLDLWTGIIDSRFHLSGTPVHLTTSCHPTLDLLAVRIASDLLTSAELGVRIAFPYGSESWSNAADWSRPDAHSSTAYPSDRGCVIERVLDATVYTVIIDASPAAWVTQIDQHVFLIRSHQPILDLVIGFCPGPARSAPSTLLTPVGVTQVAAASRQHWADFWSHGGAVELVESRDERAVELERRTVLSQYLTAIHCAGSLPPQETGLMVNSWRGRFHLEMHWWHGAHFPLWGRPQLLERSLDWYTSILPEARRIARFQGYAGARWPKQVGPDGRESPSPIGPFLIWQQPHPIFLAELIRRATGSEQTLHRYADIVLESAAFMADFAVSTPRGYQLGPPLVPAQESYAALRAELTNPTFELAYWAWGLRTAQRWRRLLGLDEEPLWTAVASGLVRPHVRDGVYTAIDVAPYTVTDDHPSLLYAWGVVPPTDVIDPRIMRATLHHVMSVWDWDSTWGWDYPAIAMTATRLGDPDAALEALLLPTSKNGYLPNGHNRQTDSLPIYLPGNGGLLAAVALMAAGSDADAAQGRTTPGFPRDGWIVRHEGLLRSP